MDQGSTPSRPQFHPGSTCRLTPEHAGSMEWSTLTVNSNGHLQRSTLEQARSVHLDGRRQRRPPRHPIPSRSRVNRNRPRREPRPHMDPNLTLVGPRLSPTPRRVDPKLPPDQPRSIPHRPRCDLGPSDRPRCERASSRLSRPHGECLPRRWDAIDCPNCLVPRIAGSKPVRTPECASSSDQPQRRAHTFVHHREGVGAVTGMTTGPCTMFARASRRGKRVPNRTAWQQARARRQARAKSPRARLLRATLLQSCKVSN